MVATAFPPLSGTELFLNSGGNFDTEEFFQVVDRDRALFILELVDDGKIGLRPAVELSYIPKDIQEYIYDTMDMEQCTPTHAQARRMRALSAENKLTEEVIEVILMEEKPNQKEKIVLRGERFRDLFPKNLPLSKREDYVAAAMEHYGRYLAKREREMER